MSYIESFTARIDQLQAHAFFVARRYQFHTHEDPLDLDFPIPELNTDPSVPIRKGFSGEDLSIVQYGRMVQVLEKGLNQEQKERWQKLEEHLIGKSVLEDYIVATMNSGDYSPNEIREAVDQLNHPEISASINLNSILFGVIRKSDEASPREIQKEKISMPLNSLLELSPFASDFKIVAPDLVQRIDAYILARMIEPET